MATEIRNTDYAMNQYWQNSINPTNAGMALERLTSGYGINYSANKSAGLSTSRDIDRELMRIELQRLEKARYDVDDTLSMLQKAETGLDDIYDRLLQIKELASQAASQGRNDRAVLEAEANALVNDIDDIAKDTEYNDQSLLDGDLAEGTGIGVQDPNGNELMIQIPNSRITELGLTTGETGLNEILSGGVGDLSKLEGAQKALDILDNAIQDVKSMKGNIDAFQRLLSDESTNLQDFQKSATAAESAIDSVGSANQTTTYIKNQILMDSTKAILAQANMTPQSVLSLLGLS